jgi:hypothetical protein
VDAQGYETVGDGTGTLIENPVEQIVHALHNWVWSSYTSDVWFTGSAPVNAAAAATAAAYFTRKGFKGSGYIKDKILGRDLIAQWLKTWDARAYWTNGGELAFAVEDHVITSPYPTALYQEDRHDVAASFEQDFDDQVISEVTVKHLYSANISSYMQQLTVSEPLVTRETPESLDMLWSYASKA